MTQPLSNERAAKRLGLTEPQLVELIAAYRSTWNNIAPDVLQGVRESGIKKMSRSHVIEVIMDIGAAGPLSPELHAWYKAGDWNSKTLAKVLQAHFSEEYV
jgi:hypothetical protein